jgi:ABC-type transport system involved in multi-copper enzyme maturation permease subunit
VTAQLRAEILKVRSTRTTVGLVLGMVALVLLFVILTASLSGVSEITSADDQLTMFGIGSFSGRFSALAGIMLVTGEFRFGTIRPTLLFTPRRDRVIGAKAAAAIFAGFVFGVLGTALAVGVGAAILSGRGIDISPGGSDFALLTLGTVAGAALWGAIGVGLGAVVRNQVGAIIGLLAWGFVVENLLFALTPSVGRFTPGEAQNALMGQSDAHLLDPLPAAAVLVAWTIAAAAAGAAMTMRRDVD